MDETDYLLSSEANAGRLFASLEQAGSRHCNHTPVVIGERTVGCLVCGQIIGEDTVETRAALATAMARAALATAMARVTPAKVIRAVCTSCHEMSGWEPPIATCVCGQRWIVTGNHLHDVRCAFGIKPEGGVKTDSLEQGPRFVKATAYDPAELADVDTVAKGHQVAYVHSEDVERELTPSEEEAVDEAAANLAAEIDAALVKSLGAQMQEQAIDLAALSERVRGLAARETRYLCHDLVCGLIGLGEYTVPLVKITAIAIAADPKRVLEIATAALPPTEVLDSLEATDGTSTCGG